MYKTRQYRIWQWMKERCKNIDNERCKNYWFRWIRYPEHWDKFEWFWKDMKEWYSDNLSLDRKDNNDHYWKNNCRWATKTEQSRNRRNTLMVWNITLKEYCEINNLGYKTIANHYNTKKWEHLKVHKRRIDEASFTN